MFWADLAASKNKQVPQPWCHNEIFDRFTMTWQGEEDRGWKERIHIMRREMTSAKDDGTVDDDPGITMSY